MPWICPPASHVHSTDAGADAAEAQRAAVDLAAQVQERVHPRAAAVEGVAHADDPLVEGASTSATAPLTSTRTPRNGRSITPSTGTPSSSSPSITPHSGEPVA